MSHGSVETDQWMETGQPIMDNYLDESEWLVVLLERGINPNEENTKEL